MSNRICFFRWPLVAFVVLSAVLFAGACGKEKSTRKKPGPDPEKEAAALTQCDRKCTRPNRCVRPAEGKPGICVRPCRRHKECMEGFRCTGSFVRSAMAGVKYAPTKGYCQKASLKEGEDCRARIEFACLAGHICFDGRCRKECKATSDCAPKRKCIALTKADAISHLSWVKKKVHSRLCLVADRPQGETCDSRKFKFCEPGLECHRGRCFQACGPKQECPAETKCVPIRIQTGVLGQKIETLYHLCRKATKAAGEACTVGKPPLCRPGLGCVKQKCTQLCRTHEDCPKGKACNLGWYSGTGWQVRRKNGWKPDFFLCGKGKRNIVARASYNPCQQTSDCNSRHSCIGRRCRPWCTADADCPRSYNYRPRCRAVPGKQGGVQKACY